MCAEKVEMRLSERAMAFKPSCVFSAAADLIEPRDHWTQGALARDDNGIDTEFGDQPGEAVCWCAVGAIYQVLPGIKDSERRKFRELAEQLLGLTTTKSGLFPLAAWSDAPERNQADVVAALRRASELAAEVGQ